MSALDSLERGLLFRITRALALLLIFLFVLAFAGGLFFGYQNLTPKQGTQVTPAEVVNDVKPPPTPAATSSADAPATPTGPLAGYKIPFVLQKYFTAPDNAAVLSRFLKRYPTYADEILTEMAAAVSAAEANTIEPSDAMNSYMTLKSARVDAEARAKEERKSLYLYYAGAGLSLVFLIGLVSLILVLLAIERNTRPPATA